MENATKITKAMVLAAIKENVENMEFAGDVTAADVTAYCDKTLEQLANKAAKAKEKAAEKKVEGDELREKIAACLTSEPKDITTILDEVGDEELTRAKVTARLAQLINLGTATKEVTKTADGKKATVYKLAE